MMIQEKMTKEQAVSILHQVTMLAPVNKAAHVDCENAVRVILDAFNAKAKEEKALMDIKEQGSAESKKTQ